MAKLVLDLDRSDISVSDFTEAFAAQIRLVQQVMVEMNIPSHEVVWVVSDLRHGSAFAAAEPHIIGKHAYMADIETATALAGVGMRSLGNSDVRPKFFSDEALKTGRRLMQLANECDNGHAQLKFGSEVVTPSPYVGANVDALIRGNLLSIGSIEGKLISVSGQDGSYSIAIKDRLRGRRVRCTIPETLLPRALQAFESRVIVRGIIYARSDGSAVRIDVRDFEVLPADTDLPGRQEVRGILNGFERADG